MEAFLATLNMPPFELALGICVVFLAGCVRGFAGFGLSAVAMAALAVLIAPAELIPVLYVLEAAASIVMFKGGLREADLSQVWPLSLGAALGLPIGLLATTTLPTEHSKLLAILLILVLTALQFSKAMPQSLNTTPGRLAVGTTAGMATGVASVGGMVIALYVLATRQKPATMRGILTLYLFFGMFVSLVYFLLFDLLTPTSLARSAVLVWPALGGIAFGSWAFRPSLQPYYRPFCLTLLIVLCLISLIRLLGGA